MAEPVRLRIDLAYDGTGFRGFARQAGQRTVQGVLEDALARLCGTAVTTTVAGRTDAGVHAVAQTVHCDVPAGARPLEDLERARGALDALCGPAVTVWRVRRVPATFDARFSATQRRYRYRICDAKAMSPLWRHDTWHLGAPRLDVAAMQAGGRHLLGEHDFSSFCRRAGDEHLIRRIDRLDIRRARADLVTLNVAGKAFCHQMVRSVTGCLVPVGQGSRAPDWVADVVAAGDRQAVGRVAPPHGLTLVGVSYARPSG
ncbi:MAG TPA: tRNA pseudouridine(38-40) synthase TruA [Egibacteraceae bacterium]|jgi:tRNA pseudouridine38-40 synthase|nr:tRNA pseudouridine(38-40) synthase TruA [Egibacteraceae bacterium]